MLMWEEAAIKDDVIEYDIEFNIIYIMRTHVVVAKSRGRTGNRLLSASLTDQALNIIRKRYADFGPTLTWEKLAENHGLLMSL